MAIGDRTIEGARQMDLLGLVMIGRRLSLANCVVELT